MIFSKTSLKNQAIRLDILVALFGIDVGLEMAVAQGLGIELQK